jgi:hypothetical protein
MDYGRLVVTSCVLEEQFASIFYPEDRGDMFFRNIVNHLQDYTVSQPRRPQSTFTLQQKPQISYDILHVLPTTYSLIWSP